MKLRNRKWEKKHVIAAVAGVTLLAAAFFAVFGAQKGAEGQSITIEQNSQEQGEQASSEGTNKTGQTVGEGEKTQLHQKGEIHSDQKGEVQSDQKGEFRSDGSDIKEQTQSPRKTDTKNLMVDVDGAVKQPGVVSLKEGDRVFQALDLAGGMKDDADTSSVNLARLVEDGEKIYVPKKSESYEPSAANANSTVKQNESAASSGKININKASTAELQQLPGIGPSTAEKIMEYRRQNGIFHKVEDLKNISGIGEKTFARLREKISV